MLKEWVKKSGIIDIGDTMPSFAIKLTEQFSYADYLKFPENERWEIIDGVPYNMSPAPGTEHQYVSGELFGSIWTYLKDKACQVFAAPFDVRFSGKKNEPDENVETVVQPDLVVVCDEENLDKRGCNGVPDIVVEILSPSTAYKDTSEKLALYERYGVREYWIVNPDAKYIMLYQLNGKKYSKPKYLTNADNLTSSVLTGLDIDLSSIWKE